MTAKTLQANVRAGLAHLQSDRSIAKKANVNHHMVAKVRAASQAVGETPTTDSRIGSDGVAAELRALRLAVAKLTGAIEDLQTTMIVFADCERK